MPSPSTSIFLKSCWICSSAIGFPPPGRVSTARSSASVMNPSPSRSNLAKASRSWRSAITGVVDMTTGGGAGGRGVDAQRFKVRAEWEMSELKYLKRQANRDTRLNSLNSAQA